MQFEALLLYLLLFETAQLVTVALMSWRIASAEVTLPYSALMAYRWLKDVQSARDQADGYCWGCQDG